MIYWIFSLINNNKIKWLMINYKMIYYKDLFNIIEHKMLRFNINIKKIRDIMLLML